MRRSRVLLEQGHRHRQVVGRVWPLGGGWLESRVVRHGVERYRAPRTARRVGADRVEFGERQGRVLVDTNVWRPRVRARRGPCRQRVGCRPAPCRGQRAEWPRPSGARAEPAPPHLRFSCHSFECSGDALVGSGAASRREFVIEAVLDQSVPRTGTDRQRRSRPGPLRQPRGIHDVQQRIVFDLGQPRKAS